MPDVQMAREHEGPVDAEEGEERGPGVEPGAPFGGGAPARERVEAGERNQGEEGERRLHRNGVGKELHPAGAAVFAVQERLPKTREAVGVGEAVEVGLRQELVGPGEAHDRHDRAPLVLEHVPADERTHVAGLVGAEHGVAEPVRGPDDRDRDGAGRGRGADEAGGHLEAAHDRPGKRPGRLEGVGARHADEEEEGAHRGDERGGKLGDADQAEHQAEGQPAQRRSGGAPSPRTRSRPPGTCRWPPCRS